MNKLKAKNILYNDPSYDVVVDSRMLEQHLKEKDQQISNIETKLSESEKKLEKNDDEWREICDSKLETINRLIEEKHELQHQLAEMTKKYELSSCPTGGLVDRVRNLEHQLAEKDKEETKRMEDFEKWCQEYYKSNQTAIRELEKVKGFLLEKIAEKQSCFDSGNYNDFADGVKTICELMLISIDNQIKSLTRENYNEARRLCVKLFKGEDV